MSSALIKETAWLEYLKQTFIEGNDNEIYPRLNDIASGKYLRGQGVREYQEAFFLDFMHNGLYWKNAKGEMTNKGNTVLHNKLAKRRQQIDSSFIIV